MKQNRPKEMTLIGSLYVFEAVMVLLALVINGEEGLYTGIREIINVPTILLILILTVSKLIMAYGYLTMTKWGYWMMMFYSVGVIFINIYLMFQFGLSGYIWQTIFSLYVLKFTFENRSVLLEH